MKTEAFPTYLKFSELLSSDRTQEAVAFFERGFRKGDSLEWPGEMVVFGFSPLCVFKCILNRIQITLHNHTGFRKGDSLAWPGIIVVFPRGRLSHYSVKLSSTVSQYIHDSVILVAH